MAAWGWCITHYSIINTMLFGPSYLGQKDYITYVYLPFPCSDTSWELTPMESKGNVNKHHTNSEIDSFETWHITKTTQIGLWSHCRCYVGQYIYAFAILTVFLLSHAISTQHPHTFHPASPLFFETFHPASTRYYTHWKLSYSSHPGSAVQLHIYSGVFKNICVHQNSTVLVNKEY